MSVQSELRRRRLDALEREGWEVIARSRTGSVRRKGERGGVWTIAAAARAPASRARALADAARQPAHGLAGVDTPENVSSERAEPAELWLP
jgi:hypothetical protein